MTTEHPSLFDRLGGVEACRAVVNDFYMRLLNDEGLAFFFDDVTMAALKLHQLEFLKIAFTGIPEDMDVSAFLLEKHARLFRTKGLNADHFDLVAGHLVASLEHLQVPAGLIEEATGVVLPLRPIFEKGAETFLGNNNNNINKKGIVEENEQEESKTSRNNDPPLAHTTLLGKLGGADALRAAVELLYKKLLEEPETAFYFEDINMAWLKQHQIDFMKIAFSQVPDDLDVAAMMKEKHAALFDKGLNAKHFDLVAKCFVEALSELHMEQALIDDAVAAIGPLRPVFEEGAKNAAEKEIAAVS